MKKFKKLLTALVCLILAINLFTLTACEKEGENSSSSPQNSSSLEVHTHTYGEWELTLPTATQTGLAEKVCSLCDESAEGHKITKVLPKLDSSDYSKSKDSATCFESGIITYSITIDNENFTFDVGTLQTDHDYGAWIDEIPATTETTGVVGHYKCSYCEKNFNQDHKIITDENMVIAQLWTTNDTHHWLGTAQNNLGEHTFDNGVETTAPTLDEKGCMTYTCTVCGFTKTEDIPSLNESEGGVLGENAEILFNETGTLTGTKQLGKGVKLVASTEKEVQFIESSATKDGIDFTHALSLIGKINQDSRYIQISVSKACTVKVYAASSSSTATRNLNVYTSLDDVSTTGIYITKTVGVSSSVTVLEYSLSSQGIYYFGSETGGIRIYGLYFTFTDAISHNFATEWSSNDTYHWHACLDQDCQEVSDQTRHTFDNGVETKPATTTETGINTFTCVECGKTKEEEIPMLNEEIVPSIMTEDTDLIFSADTDLTKELAKGVKVVQTAEKNVSIGEDTKNKDGLTFTHSINLIGKINQDSRYIEIAVDGPFTLKIYAVSGSTSTARTLMLLNSLADVTIDSAIQTYTVGTGGNLKVFEFSLTESGTYYIGSQSGGINIYAIYASKGLHTYNAEWSSDETYHWHECADAECDRIIDKEEHTFGAGVETKPATTTETGIKTFTCVECGKTKEEEIPMLEETDTEQPQESVISEDTSYLFSADTNFDEELIPGLSVTYSTEKPITLVDNPMSKDGIDFTHAVSMGGKINADSRHVKITVSGPCTIKLYVLASANRNLMFFNSVDDVTVNGALATQQVAKSSELSVVEFTVTEGGTYYIGSETGGYSIYGIFVTF